MPERVSSWAVARSENGDKLHVGGGQHGLLYAPTEVTVAVNGDTNRSE